MPEVTLWSFVNWPFPRPRPLAARLLPRKWSLQGNWGGGGVQIKEEACMMPFCPEAGNSYERLNQTLQLPQKPNFGSNQESLKSGWTCSGTGVWLLIKCHIMCRGAEASRRPVVNDCSNPKLMFCMEALLTFLMYLTVPEKMIFFLLTKQVASGGLTFLKEEKILSAVWFHDTMSQKNR